MYELVNIKSTLDIGPKQINIIKGIATQRRKVWRTKFSMGFKLDKIEPLITTPDLQLGKKSNIAIV